MNCINNYFLLFSPMSIRNITFRNLYFYFFCVWFFILHVLNFQSAILGSPSQILKIWRWICNEQPNNTVGTKIHIASCKNLRENEFFLSKQLKRGSFLCLEWYSPNENELLERWRDVLFLASFEKSECREFQVLV